MTKYHVKGEGPELRRVRSRAKYRRMRGKVERGEITQDKYFTWVKKQLGL
jgi:hypothetical protein